MVLSPVRGAGCALCLSPACCHGPSVQLLVGVVVIDVTTCSWTGASPPHPPNPCCPTPTAFTTLRLARYALHFLTVYGVAFASINYATRFNDEDAWHTLFWVAFLFGIFGQVRRRLTAPAQSARERGSACSRAVGGVGRAMVECWSGRTAM